MSALPSASERPSAVARILHSLAFQPGSGFEELVTGFSHRWLEAFPGSKLESQQTMSQRSWWQARALLPQVLLRGFGDFTLVISGGFPPADLLSGLAGKHALLVLASDAGLDACQAHPGRRHWVVSTASMMVQVLGGNSIERFLKLVREQVTQHSLIPFQTTRPVIGPMFRGRRNEVDRLLEDDETSYALVGASRIGKTSVARQFMHELLISRDARAERVYFINLQELPSRQSDDVARFIAMKIESSSNADRVRFHTFAAFLKRMSALKGGALQIILDEADEICGEPVFDLLCDLSRENNPAVRPTWIGRGKLLHDLTFAGAKGAQRVASLRPSPLNEEEAWQLFSLPLLQWGVEFVQAEKLRSEVYRRTSGLPHLVQELGRGVCDAICDGAPLQVSVETLADASDRFLGLSRLIGHVNDMQGTQAKVAAYVVLLRDGERGAESWSPVRLMTAMNSFGQHITTAQAIELSVELALHNFLIWQRGEFRPGRWDFRRIAARNSDTITRLIEDLQRGTTS